MGKLYLCNYENGDLEIWNLTDEQANLLEILIEKGWIVDEIELQSMEVVEF